MAGFAVTQPFEVVNASKSRLIVNVGDTVPGRSWVDVEVIDPRTGEAVPGYGRRDCRHVNRDGLRLPVCWGDRATLEGVNAQSIAFKFRIYGDAKLYSFGFGELGAASRQLGQELIRAKTIAPDSGS